MLARSIRRSTGGTAWEKGSRHRDAWGARTLISPMLGLVCEARNSQKWSWMFLLLQKLEVLLNRAVSLSPWGHLSSLIVYETTCVFWTNGSFLCLAMHSNPLGPSPRGLGGTANRIWGHLDLVLASGQPWASYLMCLSLKSLVWNSARAQHNYLPNHLLQRLWDLQSGVKDRFIGLSAVTLHLEGAPMLFPPCYQCHDSVREVEAARHSCQRGQDPGLACNASGKGRCSAVPNGNVNQEGWVTLDTQSDATSSSLGKERKEKMVIHTGVGITGKTGLTRSHLVNSTRCQPHQSFTFSWQGELQLTQCT